MEPITITEGQLGKWARIAIVQIEVPFGTELVEQAATPPEAAPLFIYKHSTAQTRKIVELLEQLATVGVNIATFPEYSVPEEGITEIAAKADELGILAILGSYHVSDRASVQYRKNVCPVVLPGQGIFLAEKYSLSDEEEGRVYLALRVAHAVPLTSCHDWAVLARIRADSRPIASGEGMTLQSRRA